MKDAEKKSLFSILPGTLLSKMTGETGTLEKWIPGQRKKIKKICHENRFFCILIK